MIGIPTAWNTRAQLAQAQMMNSAYQQQQIYQNQMTAQMNMLAQPQLAEAYRSDHVAGVKEMRRAWHKPDIDRGEHIIERIAFWNEIPLVGKIVADELADSLDEISAKLETVDG